MGPDWSDGASESDRDAALMEMGRSAKGCAAEGLHVVTFSGVPHCPCAAVPPRYCQPSLDLTQHITLTFNFIKQAFT